MRSDSLFVPAKNAANLYRDIPEGYRIARKRKPEGRHCIEHDCITTLSSYNPALTCFVHTRPIFVRA